MKHSQHTPGPWWYDIDCIQGAENENVATICQSDKSTMYANARLIAAAPELLEALERLTASCEDVSRNGMTHARVEQRDRLTVSARALLSRIEGETK